MNVEHRPAHPATELKVPENGVPELWERVPIPSNSSATKEPTKQQLFFRDMYRTGKLSPYQKDRPGVNLKKAVEAWKNPETQGQTSRIMAADLALRGGADKEYNQLGDVGHRATRMGVMALNSLPAIALDVVTSIPPNLLTTRFKVHFKHDYDAATDDLKRDRNDPDKQKRLDEIARKIWLLKLASKTGEVMNDKNVTAAGDWWMRKLTGEKSGWFTGESSDKLNDLLTYGFGDKIEDFINGPAIESAFRVLYEIPVLGALAEQAWTRWTLFQSKNAFTKGNLKGVYAGIGLGIGILRNADLNIPTTPSWRISDAIWNAIQKNDANKVKRK